jgi:hypothetical protein
VGAGEEHHHDLVPGDRLEQVLVCWLHHEYAVKHLGEEEEVSRIDSVPYVVVLVVASAAGSCLGPGFGPVCCHVVAGLASYQAALGIAHLEHFRFQSRWRLLASRTESQEFQMALFAR